MGYAIAQAALNAGAKVSLISGPVNIEPPQGCQFIKVTSAQEMHQQALSLTQDQHNNVNVFVACAAVADYRLENIAQQKIKKTDTNDTMQINLIKNPDIVADVAKLPNKPFVVGFAAETQDIAKYAQDKLIRKNLDLIAANDVAQQNQGFNSNQNALTVYSALEQFDIALANKVQVAQQLVTIITQQNTHIKK
jgi:phosphopantothenoylcysteine decarboxylase/phosphopantothenate--cysteine ligase